MNKTMLSVAAVLAIGVGSAQAADLPAKVYTKAPPVVAFDPWDVAFGGAIMSDYVFRGISQSNQKPSVTAYFEPRYNINPNLQLYVGSSFESISFTNRAAAEVDIYGGIRPTFGPVAFDFGVWGYLYPGGKCADSLIAPGACPLALDTVYVANGNIMKKDVSFYEAYGKVNYTFNDTFSLGATAFYSPNFLNFGTEGTYASVVGKVIVPPTWFGTSGIGAFVSGEFGRQWLGRTDGFYGNIVLPDYNTWNVGLGFTYKVFTLDLRYTDTDLSKGNCQAITSDFGSNGVESNWCGERFTAKLSADVTLQAVK
ncbi:TorF family putative porin [Rhodopseudomonas palustris]|uniref:Porin n=1 Tax=Rhodopseudomonas palustris (strain BisB18) TaxID=316056 RepID=Q20X82_RHOPB